MGTAVVVRIPAADTVGASVVTNAVAVGAAAERPVVVVVAKVAGARPVAICTGLATGTAVQRPAAVAGTVVVPQAVASSVPCSLDCTH